jgi:hypothetical protein
MLGLKHATIKPKSIVGLLGKKKIGANLPASLHVSIVAWSSELFVFWLFVFRCGLEFRAICISMWLGVPSYLYFAVAWIFRAICISLWLGVPSSFNFAVAWSSELFVFQVRCGLEFRAICISLWLGVPSSFNFAVAWSSELFVFRCGLEFRALLISL